VDVCVSASQKGLMGPPGLAVVAAGPKAMEVHRATKRERLYWDWTLRGEGAGYRAFCGTIPEHSIFALAEALTLIAEETPEAIFARHRLLAGAVHTAVEAWGSAGALEIHAVNPAERSVGVTTVRTAAGIDPDAIRTTARHLFRTSVAGSLGTLSGQAFRIGHLGDMNAPMLLGCLAGVQATLDYLGVPHGSGALDAAIGHIAEGTAPRLQAAAQ
jgi:alanine-glyoxylate transaminase/serine-glyoxylate transaminase/serine-pyruvate transaminase